MTYILGIESSCDETAAAVVIDGKTIASNIVASQIDLHAEHGGVFPELASRAHVEAIDSVVSQAVRDAGAETAGRAGYDSRLAGKPSGTAVAVAWLLGHAVLMRSEGKGAGAPDGACRRPYSMAVPDRAS